ncbi:DUF167 domain-containing protein [Actinomadura alba]|nr:DUF167 domain-containing protein [Actinomadura alba]
MGLEVWMGMRVAIRVRPGAARTGVGGAYGDALVVRVAARAVEGKATEAALRAVAEALGVRRRDVSLVSGATSRDKVVEVDGDVAQLTREIDRLLGS